MKQVPSSRNSRNLFVGNVMAGIVAPVTASRTIGSRVAQCLLGALPDIAPHDQRVRSTPANGHRLLGRSCPESVKTEVVLSLAAPGLTLSEYCPFKRGHGFWKVPMNEVPTLVSSCINCVAPGSLSATLAVILIGAGIAWMAEQRKLARVRLDK